jgi:hypothetical protein
MEVFVSCGANTQNWIIPKALLSHHSEFFRAACNRPFKEGTENKITLHDCYPKIFEGFVHWLYFAILRDDNPMWGSVYYSFHLWILGDRLLAAEFKNAAMRDIYGAHRLSTSATVTPQEIEHIRRHTADKSALRRWVLDFVSLTWKRHCEFCEESKCMELFREIPDFGRSLLLRLGTQNTNLKIKNDLEEAKTAHDELDAEKQ